MKSFDKTYRGHLGGKYGLISSEGKQESFAITDLLSNDISQN